MRIAAYLNGRVLRCLFVGGALALAVGPLAALATQPDKKLMEQRRAFTDAYHALQKGNTAVYERVADKLGDYVLSPYLRVEILMRNPGAVPPAEIHSFLDQFAGSPLEQRLRRAWLLYLAKNGRWQEFFADYREGVAGSQLRCINLGARLERGERGAVVPEIEKVWLTGESLPTECEPLFDAWREMGGMTRDKVVARIQLAIERGDSGLAMQLSRLLSPADRPWVERWQRMYRSPAMELPKLNASADSYWSAILFTQGVRRLARENPGQADDYWNQREAFALTPEQEAQGAKAVALALALQYDPRAPKRLAEVPEAGRSPEIRQWHVRTHVRRREWNEALAAIERLTPEEQQLEVWEYWRGRALESLGRVEEAKRYYKSAADCVCYYGFLASERLGLAPNFVTRFGALDQREMERLGQLPAMQRTAEFYAIGELVEARREWREATATMEPDQLRGAARLADAWGWHDQAIFTLGRTQFMSDLDVRFPTPYQEQVARAAERREIDMAFIYAVMRQESAFNSEARSPVGALGLMQLMPATARNTARRFNVSLPNTRQLLSPETNITVGTAHLRQLLDEYQGNRVYTMAAYNAGAHRVSKWKPKEEALPGDIWIASMPFAETRGYVKRILSYTMIYQWRLGQSVTPLSTWLKELLPDAATQANNRVDSGSPPPQLQEEGSATPPERRS